MNISIANSIEFPFFFRFAFSVRWEMTPDAKIIKTIFHKSIIKSRVCLLFVADNYYDLQKK